MGMAEQDRPLPLRKALMNMKRVGVIICLGCSLLTLLNLVAAVKLVLDGEWLGFVIAAFFVWLASGFAVTGFQIATGRRRYRGLPEFPKS